MTHKAAGSFSLSPFLFFLGFVSIFLIGLGFYLGWNFLKSSEFQSSLDPFYSSITPTGKSGDILRQEQISMPVPNNGKAYRVLYQSELSDGTPTVVSGVIYVPAGNVPTEGRKVIAWAHGTIGMGKECAPSRTQNPMAQIGGLSQMMENGWVVVATDYYGLGTKGSEHYLIGEDEAKDVLNSVRAAQRFPQAQASKEFALWGHSQGGHSVLFAANEYLSYAPELKLVAVAAGAPAAELPTLMNKEYAGTVPWVIGPEMVVAWPTVYKNLETKNVLTNIGLANYQRLAFECALPSGLEAIIRSSIGERFFAVDPTTNSTWNQALTDQVPEIVKSAPLFIAQSLTDQIVLPETTAMYIKRSCNSGSNLSVDWISGNVSHQQTALVAGPAVADWLKDRFEGKPVVNTCNKPLPANL